MYKMQQLFVGSLDSPLQVSYILMWWKHSLCPHEINIVSKVAINNYHSGTASCDGLVCCDYKVHRLVVSEPDPHMQGSGSETFQLVALV